MEWSSFFYIIGLILGIILLFGLIKGNPEMFKGENINKSFTTLGILALLLIALVVFCILLLR